uniref:Uncharacterized protein n=1 Tax=Sphaerodactylus townsendi TaxID=933632 RepID=A0ACB8EQ61_9SAUR
MGLLPPAPRQGREVGAFLKRVRLPAARVLGEMSFDQVPSGRPPIGLEEREGGKHSGRAIKWESITEPPGGRPKGGTGGERGQLLSLGQVIALDTQEPRRHPDVNSGRPAGGGNRMVLCGWEKAKVRCQRAACLPARPLWSPLPPRETPAMGTCVARWPPAYSPSRPAWVDLHPKLTRRP